MAEDVVRNVVEVDVRPLPQSSGHVLPGGDCGYCCMAGIFGLPSIVAAYEFRERHTVGDPSWKRRGSMSVYHWRYILEALDLPFEEVRPTFDHYKRGLAEVPWENFNWIKTVEEHIAAGVALVTSIRFNAAVPPPPVMYEKPESYTGRAPDSDHNVIINATRVRVVPHPTMKGAARHDREVRIACSMRGEYWMEWSHLLYWHHAHPTIPIDHAKARAAVAKLAG